MGQTYQNFEVIVVGDGCTDDTAARVEAFGDPRVRFVNMPFRFPYPSDPVDRWRVTGGPGWNYAAELARGTWLAMLGDDDAFEPHHLECLLETALNTRSEMAYGNTRKVLPPPQPEVVHATYPPQCFEFNCMSAIQMRALSFFEFDVKSWVVEEPSDWNWCRRMIEAGVRIGYVDRVVVNWYSSRDWADE
jgi:glycosyltransferase involved in cell wall biosynthesis